MKKYLTAAVLLGTIGFTGISMANPKVIWLWLL